MRLLVDQSQHLEYLKVVGEVFGVVGQSDGCDTQLHQGMHEQHELRQVLSHSECPYLNAVVELPRVNVLDSVLRKIVPDVSDVQAQLSNIQEAQLVACNQVQSQNLSKAILRNANSVLYLEATTSDLALLGEIVVHAFDCKFKESVILLLGLVSGVLGCIQDQHCSKGLKSENLCGLLHLRVLNADLGAA